MLLHAGMSQSLRPIGAGRLDHRVGPPIARLGDSICAFGVPAWRATMNTRSGGNEVPDARETLAASMRALIKSSGARSARQFASDHGLPQAIVSRVLIGKHGTNLDTISAIASACGKRPWELLKDDDLPSPPTTLRAWKPSRRARQLARMFDAMDRESDKSRAFSIALRLFAPRA